MRRDLRSFPQNGLSIGRVLLASILGGVTGAVTELFSSSEMDTFTVPIAILIILILLV